MTSTGRNGRWLHCEIDGKKMEVTVRDADNNIVEDECFTLYAAELNDYKVNFGVSAGDGTLTAAVDGEAIADGDFVQECKDVEFKAEPGDGYKVKAWIVNGQEMESDAATYVVEGISEDTSVEVSFEKIGGITGTEDLSYFVYPNPCVDEVYVAGAEGSLLKVTDVSGRIQFTRHISGDNEAVSLSGLSDGVYFFIVEKDRQVKVYKVVKNAK